MIKEKRKNITLSAERSRELSRLALSISEELAQTVPKQTVLEVLILQLGKNEALYNKTKALIKEIIKQKTNG